MPFGRANGTVLLAAAGWGDEHIGGANKLPTDFARFLARRGHHVAYLGASANISAPSKSAIDGVDVWRYPSPRGSSPSLLNLRDHWRAARSIADAVHRERPVTAVLGHSPLQYLAAAGACPDARRCYGVHSPFVDELKEGLTAQPTLKQRGAWAVAGLIERRLLTMSHVVHYDSAFTGRLMESEYPAAVRGKGVVLPGWVDSARFRPAVEPRAALRRRLGAPWQPAAPTFFSLRRLVPRMGLDLLIAAAARLAQKGRAFRVVIGGDGPERANLESMVSSLELGGHVTFLGRIPDERLVDCFAAADCFVLPTRALECFGLIVLESYACGVPVIGVPVGSIPEVMGPSFAHWIADDNQPDAIARRMDDVLNGALTVDAGALRARALDFSFESIAERHEQTLLQRPAQGAVA